MQVEGAGAQRQRAQAWHGVRTVNALRSQSTVPVSCAVCRLRVAQSARAWLQSQITFGRRRHKLVVTVACYIAQRYRVTKGLQNTAAQQAHAATRAYARTTQSLPAYQHTHDTGDRGWWWA